MAAVSRRGQAPFPSQRIVQMDVNFEDAAAMQPSKPALKEKSLMHTSNKKIFIGPAFQASIEPVLAEGPEREDYEHRTRNPEILLWQPTDLVSEEKLKQIVETLKPRGFDEDQILAFLNYQLNQKNSPNTAIDATLHALGGIYVGKQEGMPMHDKVLFVQGYGFHGKNFERIRDLVPNHSLQSLVNHYYTEFKRGKQIRVSGARPETDVRKLTNAAALALVADAPNGHRGGHMGSFNAGHQDLITARLRILEGGDADFREASKNNGGVAENGIAGLDGVTIANDDPTDASEKHERQRLEICQTELPKVAEKLTPLRDSPPPEMNGALEEIVAEAREATQKDPTPVWQQEEIVIFMRSLVEFGTDFAKSSLLLPSKTEQQVRNMYYNREYFYGLDKLVQVHADRLANKSG